MTVRAIIDQAIGMVITPNFVEAEDISDALRRFGFENVIHCRSADQAVDLLSPDDTPPTIALMSFHEVDADAERLLAMLHAAGSLQVLINGDASYASDHNAVFLHRPYSDQELDRCIADVMAAG